MEPPCWCHPDGHQYCGRKPTETSSCRNSIVVYHKTKNPFGTKLCMDNSFQLFLYIIGNLLCHKMTTMCSPMIGQFFDIMIIATWYFHSRADMQIYWNYTHICIYSGFELERNIVFVARTSVKLFCNYGFILLLFLSRYAGDAGLLLIYTVRGKDFSVMLLSINIR